MNFKFKTLMIKKTDPQIITLMLNRPERRNAINSEMIVDLLKFWRSIRNHSKKFRCIILTGIDQSFCAGADLKERLNLPIKIWQAQHNRLRQTFFEMMNCPLPIIAAVNGPAFGGGLELILASDFAYAVESALFAQSEVKIGLIPGALGTQNLPRTVGIKRAKELIFTASAFSAKEALQWGIINKICESSTLLEEVEKTARQIAQQSPLAIIEAKKAINFLQKDLKSGAKCELDAYRKILKTEDRIEGIRAFNEKRQPNFKGK